MTRTALTIAWAAWWLLPLWALAAGATSGKSAPIAAESAPPTVVASDWIDLTLPPPTKAGQEIILQTYLHNSAVAFPSATMWFVVDSGTVRRTATDGSGVAQLHVRDLTAGTHTVVASYYISYEKAWVSVSGGFTILPLRLTINTVPSMPGVTFTVTGVTYSATFASDAQGTAAIDVPEAGQPTLTATPPPDLDNRRVLFSRWSDDALTGSRPLRLHDDLSIDYGLRISYLTPIRFVDMEGKVLDTQRVADLVLNGPNAEVVSLQAPYAPVWLTTALPSRGTGQPALHVTPAPYTVATATYDGLSVVNRGGVRYTPALGGVWTIALLLYDLRIKARDPIFGTSYGNFRVAMVDPNGKKRELLLDGHGTTSVTLGRGIYSLRVIAPGISPTAPVALSRSQTAIVPVISPRDILLVAGSSLALMVIMFVVARRRDRIVTAARRGHGTARRVAAWAIRRPDAPSTPQHAGSPILPSSPVVRQGYIKPYPPEFRAEAVRLVGLGSRTISAVAKDLGVSTGSLRNWVKQAGVPNGHHTDGLPTGELTPAAPGAASIGGSMKRSRSS